MRPEIKFALFCCTVCTLISLVSLLFQGGWLTALIGFYFSIPLIFIIEGGVKFFGLNYPNKSFLFFLIVININIFSISLLVSKTCISLKNFIKLKISRKK